MINEREYPYHVIRQSHNDLTALKGVEKSFGFTGAAKAPALRIGDTAEDFNKMAVNVQAMPAQANQLPRGVLQLLGYPPRNNRRI